MCERESGIMKNGELRVDIVHYHDVVEDMFVDLYNLRSRTAFMVLSNLS